MGIKRPFRRRRGKRAPPGARWRHEQWPARSVERLVVSFPKSGRTWLRVLMGAAEAGRQGADVGAVVSQWLAEEAPSLGGMPVLFSHALSEEPDEPLRHLDLFLEYVGDRRRVFLLRDPRDQVVSYYFQRVKREKRRPDLPAELGAFLRDERWGIDRTLHFMAACQRSIERDPGPSLLLTYEALHRDAVGSLARVLSFFGAGDLPREELERVAEYGQFENMRRLETDASLRKTNDRLRALDPGDPETFKTRKGAIGSYVEHLTRDDVAHIEARMAALLPAEIRYAEPGVDPLAPSVQQPVHGRNEASFADAESPA